jgi:GTP-binding protein
MDLMDVAAVGYQIILTKCDKVKAIELEKLIQIIDKEIATHVAAHPNIVITSSYKKKGIEELRAVLNELTSTSTK